MVKRILFLIFFVSVIPVSGSAQNSDELNFDEDVESLDTDFIRKVKTLKAKKLSDLVHLSPFSDVAVIQRRFMPKTGRVSISLASTFTLSSEFFLNPGIGGHFSYNFLEKHGLELSGYYAFTFNRGVTNDLITVGANASEKLPIARSFFGLTYKWMPIYGKIAFHNRSIFAFDTYFNLGGGMSEIKAVWEPAVVSGIGQIFAITRNLGFRWDLRWQVAFQTGKKFQALSDVLFSIGLSYYYPSAGLR